MFFIIESQLRENGQRVLSTLNQVDHNDNLSNITSYVSQYIRPDRGVVNRSIELFVEGNDILSQVSQSLPTLVETEMMVDEPFSMSPAILLQAVENLFRRGSPHRHDLYHGPSQ